MVLREIVVDDVWWVVFTGRAGRNDSACLWAQSLSDKRRIGPIPPGWEAWPDQDLAQAIRDARPLPLVPLP